MNRVSTKNLIKSVVTKERDSLDGGVSNIFSQFPRTFRPSLQEESNDLFNGQHFASF
jgi:hypothetical protein